LFSRWTGEDTSSIIQLLDGRGRPFSIVQPLDGRGRPSSINCDAHGRE